MPIGELLIQDEGYNNTSLTYLIINSNVQFSQSQIFKILNLSIDNPIHNRVYDQLISIINTTTKNLYHNVHEENLQKYPLTNLQYLSFMIADKFPEIFYCPIWLLEEFESEQADSVLIRKSLHDTISWVLKRCRYNEMWIITYLIKQEFTKFIQQLQ